MNKGIFQSFPELKTEHLWLRDLRIDHLQELLPIFFHKEGEAHDKRKPLKIIEKVQLGFFKHEALTWGIFTETKLVGTCGYYRGFKDNIGEIGYVMNAKFRGKGWMKEALKQIIKFGFEEMELVEIRAYTAKDNLPSVKLLERLGFEADLYWLEGQPGFSLKQ